MPEQLKKLLLKGILKENYLVVKADKLEIVEDYSNDISLIKCFLFIGNDFLKIEGTGSGLVDALFRGFFGPQLKEYRSIESLVLTHYKVTAKLDKKYGSSCNVEVAIELTGKNGRVHKFSATSFSLVKASLDCLLQALELYINGEQAFKTIKKAISDASDRNRQDLISRYTGELFEIVKLTDYDF